MDKLQEINEYVSTMKIKKTLFGGYDREDVYVKIGTIVEMFQRCIEELEEKQKALIDEYEGKMNTSDTLIEELNEKITSLSERQKDTEEEKVKLKEAYRDYCSGILQEYSDSLRTLSVEFTKIIDNVANIQKNIVDTDFFDAFESEIEMKDIKHIEAENMESEE